MAELMNCPDCKALVTNISGPTHAYLGASAGCWKIYGDILAKEYSDPDHMKVHRLTVDAYAVQHPGIPAPRAIQSVNVHLLALFLILEKKCDFKSATYAMGRLIEKNKGKFIWLAPPKSLGKITVIDVVKAANATEHQKSVKDWAASAWLAWQYHHEKIRLLARQLPG